MDEALHLERDWFSPWTSSAVGGIAALQRLVEGMCFGCFRTSKFIEIE